MNYGNEQYMTMDRAIILTSLVSFMLFLIFQVIVFRRIPRIQVLSWMVNVFIITGVMVTAALPLFLNNISWSAFVLFGAVSWLLYGLVSLIYILAVFGIIESSIRIRLLAEIVPRGTGGITLKELYRTYNRDSIVKKRLERFLSTGDISYDGKQYRIARRFSPFSIPGTAFSLLWKLYRG